MILDLFARDVGQFAMPDDSAKVRIPDPEHLTALEPEEVGAALFEVLRADPKGKFSLYGTVYEAIQDYFVGNVPADTRHQIERAIGEAWSWLEREGFLVPDPSENDRLWFVLSRRAGQLQTAADVEAYRQAALLPKSHLHASIAGKVPPRLHARRIRISTVSTGSLSGSLL